MFESVVARLRAPRKQPNNARRLRVDRLEARDVPATVVDPLATFSGTVDAPRQPGWVQMQVETPSRVLLAFETEPAAGSSFQPGPLKMFEGEGAQSRAVGVAGIHGYALATVTSGVAFARAGGARGSVGGFDVNVTLAGDVNGDHQVDAQDLDMIRALRGVRAGEPGYLAAADVNHNGVIGVGDLQLAARNVGKTATVGPITADQFLFADSGPRYAQFNSQLPGISLVINGINDSTTPIAAEAFSWGVSNGGTGLPTKSDLAVLAPTGADSPLLFKAVVMGTHFPDATLFAGRIGTGAAAKPKLEWDMNDVLVTSYTIGGNQGNGTHLEDSFTLSFTQLRVKYTPTLPNGRPGTPVSAGYDFSSGKGL
jgi:type VI secretion system secreted protein Hcp